MVRSDRGAVNVNAVQNIDAVNVEFAKTFDNIGEVLGRDRGAVQALERDALRLVALIGQFEADADAAEIIAQLTAKGCSGLGVELRVEAIVRQIGRASCRERVCQYV